jgi:hypothetical protein
MHHAMRMTIRLRFELFIDHGLIMPAGLHQRTPLLVAHQRGGQYQRQRQQAGRQSDAVAQQQSPFLSRDPQCDGYPAHAGTLPSA